MKATRARRPRRLSTPWIHLSNKGPRPGCNACFSHSLVTLANVTISVVTAAKVTVVVDTYLNPLVVLTPVAMANCHQDCWHDLIPTPASPGHTVTSTHQDALNMAKTGSTSPITIERRCEMREGESKQYRKAKGMYPKGFLPLRLSTNLLSVLVPFDILCKIYKIWNIKKDILYQATVHNQKAGKKNASNPIHKHVHGVNCDPNKRFTTLVSVVAEVSCVLKLYTMHAYKQLGMSFIVSFFFISQKVSNHVWYIEGKKRQQCLCRDCCEMCDSK